jgi:acyl-[acyl carrier protein]--UDP-N-acetylglucosamine O-acyltransferase
MGQPARWAGLNRIALEREGWSRERIASAESALRIVLRRGLRLEHAMDALSDVDTPEAERLLAFVQEVGRGILRP